jgi:hypothetical protein
LKHELKTSLILSTKTPIDSNEDASTVKTIVRTKETLVGEAFTSV